MRRAAVHLLALVICVSGLGSTVPAAAATDSDRPPPVPAASTTAAPAAARVHVTVTEASDPAEGTLVRINATGGGRAVLELRDSGALVALPAESLTVALEAGRGSLRVPLLVLSDGARHEVTARFR